MRGPRYASQDANRGRKRLRRKRSAPTSNATPATGSAPPRPDDVNPLGPMTAAVCGVAVAPRLTFGPKLPSSSTACTVTVCVPGGTARCSTVPAGPVGATACGLPLPNFTMYDDTFPAYQSSPGAVNDAVS